jgi:2-polyprenyl-6-methoxyphenol hydroxylase-like FAD-dependent oxidoreductase
MIDFWGKGFDLVKRMGLLPRVEERGYHIKEVRFVHGDGTHAGGFSTESFLRATESRFTSIPRSELAEVIWRALPSSIETRFGDEVKQLEPRGDAVRAHFANSSAETFDLVVGADALHSQIRQLLFGPEDRFETFLGYSFAAFTVAGYGSRTTDTYVGHGVPGRHVSRVSMRNDQTLVLLIWRDRSSSLPSNDEDRRALLRERFTGVGRETDRMLEALDSANDLYIDRMSQIHLPGWSEGSVDLVGDAASAPSFLAGEGCGLGIIGAYTLAGDLARLDGAPVALGRYEQRLRGFIEAKQKMATRFGGAFCPNTRLSLTFRNWVASLLNVPLIADLALSRELRDEIDLPDYRAGTETFLDTPI